MPSPERKQILSTIQGNPLSRFPLVMTNPYQGNYNPNINMYGQPYGMNYNQGRQGGPNRNVNRRPPQQGYPTHQIPQQQIQEQQVQGTREDEPNIAYFDSLETKESQKEYLGEFLFKKIEQHPIANENRFTIDTIGRITGMIIGIDNIKEIYEITTNYDNLTSRINEAMNLLKDQQIE